MVVFYFDVIFSIKLVHAYINNKLSAINHSNISKIISSCISLQNDEVIKKP